MSTQPPTTPVLPLIDLGWCTGCGLCAELCPTHAVEIHNRQAVLVRPEACSFCDICEASCPEHAIGRPFTIVFAADDPAH